MGGLDRRTFLKVLGAGTGMSLLPACTDAPVEKLHAYLKPPQEGLPGRADWYATVCRDCPAGCGLHVKVREGRPIKVEGNPRCPVSQGALCLRGQSVLQELYGPDRILRPQIGRPGETRRASVRKALEFLGKKLKSLKQVQPDVPGSVWLLTNAQTATASFFYDQLAKIWQARWIAYEPIQFAALKRASAHLFERNEVPRLDLSGVDFVLNLGADLFESWQSPVEHARQFSKQHGFQEGTRAPFVCVGPRRDLTAAMADEWIPVRCGTQGWLALSLARQLLPSSRLEPDEKQKLSDWLEPYELTRVAGLADCDIRRLRALADQLGRASRPVAVPPAETQLGKEAAFDQAAVLVLNQVLGATGKAILYDQANPYSRIAPASRIKKMLDAAAKKNVSALILVDQNPVYDWPDRDAVRKALSKIPLVVQLTREPNETSRFAHAILPSSHFLESWGDYLPRGDWIGLQQPVSRPRAEQLQAEDWLISLSATAGTALPWSDYRQCLAQRWAGIQQNLNPAGVSTSFFRSALRRGGQTLPQAQEPDPAASNVWGPDRAAPERTGQVNLVAAAMPPGGLAERKPTGRPWLLPYASGRLYDGRCANRSWIQEFPDPLTQTVWDTPLEISPGRAKREGLKSGDRVEAAGAGGIVTGTVRVMPGMRDDLVALPLGGGREEAGRIASGLGARAWSLLKTDLDPESGALAMLQTSVILNKVGPGRLLTVEGDPTTHGRPIVGTVQLRDALAGRFPKQTLHGVVMIDSHTGEEVLPPHKLAHKDSTKRAGHPEDRLPENGFNPQHDYPEHQWGMVVDLDLCNGCGACVVACQAENNIATVGPDQIELGREMHWLRIERYWLEAGRRSRPVPRFLPVMCQHCENAPCEPVCPVFASYHTRDGLNAQIYNRCIGTRYCSNNCPYKVRRFNWFDYPWPEPLNEQLNPDVSVRSAGVMEKCTFCVQRIREKVNLAKVENRVVRPGEIQPACVQTCPTGALVFGDRKDPGSKVSLLSKDPRGYRLLDYQINTKPAVTYLCKVERPGVDRSG